MRNGVGVFMNFISDYDEYTREHSDRVTTYSLRIAERLGWNEREKQLLKWQAQTHDVGKIGVNKAILNKPGRLTESEFAEIRKHTIYGSNFLKKFSDIVGIHYGALYHHERWDGKGYPSGIAGRKIPIEARIIAIADAYDAMSSDRCYRKKCSNSYILQQLEKGSGTQFDPDLVEIMLDILAEEMTA